MNEIDKLTTQNDLLRQELAETKVKLNAERMKLAALTEAMDGLVTDMALMEARIAELTGEELL